LSSYAEKKKTIKRRRDFFSELFQKLEDRDLNPKRFLQESTLRFWDAPVIILVFMDGRIASRFFFDIGACVQNIALAAKAEGLDTHLIGLILKYQNTIKEFLNLAPDKRLAVGVCLTFSRRESVLINLRNGWDSLNRLNVSNLSFAGVFWLQLLYRQFLISEA
jgi:nitroreductase